MPSISLHQLIECSTQLQTPTYPINKENRFVNLDYLFPAELTAQ